MSDLDPRTGDSAESGGQLRRLSLYLLVGGLIALGLSVAIQWAQFGGFSMRGGLGGSVGAALVGQVLSVLGTVCLTGAVFGFLLLAMRADREGREGR
jgi:hypothetical protein